MGCEHGQYQVRSSRPRGYRQVEERRPCLKNATSSLLESIASEHGHELRQATIKILNETSIWTSSSSRESTLGCIDPPELEAGGFTTAVIAGVPKIDGDVESEAGVPQRF